MLQAFLRFLWGSGLRLHLYTPHLPQWLTPLSSPLLLLANNGWDIHKSYHCPDSIVDLSVWPQETIKKIVLEKKQNSWHSNIKSGYRFSKCLGCQFWYCCFAIEHYMVESYIPGVPWDLGHHHPIPVGAQCFHILITPQRDFLLTWCFGPSFEAKTWAYY